MWLCCSGVGCFGQPILALTIGICPQFLIIRCVFIAGGIAWIVSKSMSVMHSSKADLMHEIKCFDRGQNSALNCCLMMLARDIQEGEERDYIGRDNETEFQ
jgi:hypothetical protein